MAKRRRESERDGSLGRSCCPEIWLHALITPTIEREVVVELAQVFRRSKKFQIYLKEKGSSLCQGELPFSLRLNRRKAMAVSVKVKVIFDLYVLRYRPPVLHRRTEPDLPGRRNSSLRQPVRQITHRSDIRYLPR